MNYRMMAVCFYFAIALLAIALCWNIYRSANTVDHAFSEFTEQDILTLDNLSRVRGNLSEHERLLYEYYATTERTPILIKLSLLRDDLEEEFSYLKTAFNNNEQYQILEKTYAGFTEELNHLDANLKASSIDWDAARESLVKLSEHGQDAVPALDHLFDVVSAKSSNTQKSVETQLGQMTLLVIGFVFVVLAVSLAVGFFIRETLHANAERRKLSYFPERNPIGVYSLSLEGELIYANPSTHRLAAKINDDLQTILPADIKDYVEKVRESEKNSLTFDYKLNDHILAASMQLLPDLKVCHVYIRDVTNERKAEKELQYLVNHDPVSDIPNRRSFLAECNNWLEEQKHAFSILMVGFHNFEMIARNLGVEAMDELIKDIGQRLSSSILEFDLGIHSAKCYRFSGTGFAILLRSNNDAEIKKVTKMAAELLIEEVSQPMHVRRREFWLHPVIGASFCPEDALTTSALINNASAAMAHLIEEGKHGYQPTITKIIDAEKNWLDIESGLRQGLEKGEFSVYYQPKVTGKGFHVHGMEALIRWDREGHGMISPVDFIPVAEDSGFIVSLGAWILDEACRQAAEWCNSGHSNFSIAINISKLQFQQDNFVSQIEQTIKKYDLKPECLDLEITESLLMQDISNNIEILNSLRQLGVGLSLDDFGTGYSSMEYLRDFPITQLKIDRTFITNITDSERESAVVRAMIELAHQLDIEVVAEGIETLEQAKKLEKLSCDQLQGYVFSKPLTSVDFNKWWLQHEKNLKGSEVYQMPSLS